MTDLRASLEATILPILDALALSESRRDRAEKSEVRLYGDLQETRAALAELRARPGVDR